MAFAKRFLRNDDASASVEYVVLLLPLLALVFTSLQIALAYHFSLTAQKAVELGARIAAVRDPVRIDLPNTNTRDEASNLGAGASCANGACLDMGGPWVCNGAALDPSVCDVAAYTDIYNEIANLAYLLQPEDVTISYDYGLLGYAGGPFVPIVEVRIEERPFFLQFLFNLAFATDDGEAQILSLPSVAATAIAEDLSSDS